MNKGIPQELSTVRTVGVLSKDVAEKLGANPYVQQMIGAIDHRINRTGNPVMGTEPVGGMQLYGWKSPVGRHIDETGDICFMPIYMTGTHTLKVHTRYGVLSASLVLGDLFFTNDYFPHEVEGDGYCIALFAGGIDRTDYRNPAFYDWFCTNAVAAIKGYLVGSDAVPRLSPKHGLMPDECFVYVGGNNVKIVKTANISTHDNVIGCSVCAKPAVKLPDDFPNQSDDEACLCHQCFKLFG